MVVIPSWELTDSENWVLLFKGGIGKCMIEDSDRFLSQGKKTAECSECGSRKRQENLAQSHGYPSLTNVMGFQR